MAAGVAEAVRVNMNEVEIDGVDDLVEVKEMEEVGEGTTVTTKLGAVGNAAGGAGLCDTPRGRDDGVEEGREEGLTNEPCWPATGEGSNKEGLELGDNDTACTNELGAVILM